MFFYFGLNLIQLYMKLRPSEQNWIELEIEFNKNIDKLFSQGILFLTIYFALFFVFVFLFLVLFSITHLD